MQEQKSLFLKNTKKVNKITYLQRFHTIFITIIFIRYLYDFIRIKYITHKIILIEIILKNITKSKHTFILHI